MTEINEKDNLSLSLSLFIFSISFSFFSLFFNPAAAMWGRGYYVIYVQPYSVIYSGGNYASRSLCNASLGVEMYGTSD